MTMENIMAKFEFDMKALQKEQQKLKQASYDLNHDEIIAQEPDSDEEAHSAENEKFREWIKERREEIRRKADGKDHYDDTPYETANDEKEHEMKQFEELS